MAKYVKKNPKGGRPVLDDDERKTIRREFVINKKENDIISMKAEKVGVTISTFCRDAALNSIVVVNDGNEMVMQEVGRLIEAIGNLNENELVVKAIEELIAVLPDPSKDRNILKELNRIGTNLNQIAYIANARKDTKGLEEKIDQIREDLVALSEKIIKS